MSRRLREALALFVLATLAGCAGEINYAELDAKAKSFSIGPINNGSLQSDCEIVSGKALYQEQLMQVTIELQSHIHRHQKVYYSWRWIDGDGYALPDDPWHWVELMGDEDRSITGTATAPRAVKAQFLLRRPSSEDHEK
jgi:hypothetical protein